MTEGLTKEQKRELELYLDEQANGRNYEREDERESKYFERRISPNIECEDVFEEIKDQIRKYGTIIGSIVAGAALVTGTLLLSKSQTVRSIFTKQPAEAPAVSGVAVNVASVRPNLTADLLKQIK